jgi:hypothetical protein
MIQIKCNFKKDKDFLRTEIKGLGKYKRTKINLIVEKIIVKRPIIQWIRLVSHLSIYSSNYIFNIKSLR